MDTPSPETPPPNNSKPEDFVPTPFRMDYTLDRLLKKGFKPKVVLDVGAAKGYWSEIATYFFLDARFYLIDPLPQNEPRLKELCAKIPRVKYHLCAVGDKPGQMQINLTPDLDGSSLLSFGVPPSADAPMVPVVTIDSLLEQGLIEPPQMVKMDIQGYELIALNGGQKLFATAEVFILEVSLREFLPGMPVVHEVVDYMARRGYWIYDVAGYLHRPIDDNLGQLDLAFVKASSQILSSKRWA